MSWPKKFRYTEPIGPSNFAIVWNFSFPIPNIYIADVDLPESSQIQYNHEFVLCTQSMSILSVNWHGGGGANINERLT